MIPKLDIDVPLVAGTVGSDGRMPSPPDLNTAVWYDFSGWPGLGGTPGVGGNVVIAGDAGVQGVGIGPLFKIVRMAAGDFAMIRLTGGETLCYRAEFNKIAPMGLFDRVTEATAQESLTLITGGTADDNRRVVWGRRVDCAIAPTPTPSALAGHHKLRIVAERNAFRIVAGGTVPPGRHTVDYEVDVDEAGVSHSIAFYDTTGTELIASEPFEGPTRAYGQFGVGPPQPPGRYTFRCSVVPGMTGFIDVQS